MSRHGKSKSKSRSGKPHGDTPVSDTPKKVKAKPPRPQKSVVAAEATGALPRDDVVRQEPAQQPAPAKALAAVEPEALPETQVVESAAESWQRSFDAARLGTVEVNRLLLDIGRRNVASGFEFAMSLATARTPIEAARLQRAFFDEHMKTLLHQAEALRTLSVDLVARASEPIREQMRMKRMGAWWG